MWARLQNVSTHFGNCSADVQLQTTAGHPTFQFGEIFGDYFVWTAWSSVTSPGSVQGAVCGHKLGFLLLQVASNKYVVLAVALRGDQQDQGRARGRVEEVDTNTK